jgi:outer membrane lipoprotein LolB
MADSRNARMRAWAVLFVLCTLSACATVAPPTAPLPSDLNELECWQAHGRLGVSGPETGGSGSFDWLQRGDRAEIQIRGPVGVGSVRIELRGDGSKPDLRLQTSDGRTLEAQAAWDELETRLGAAVPAGQLRYWLLGLAAPGEHAWLEGNADGVTTLEQSGWRIDYQRFSTDPGARVPVKMRAASGDASVRIVVDRWRLGQ